MMGRVRRLKVGLGVALAGLVLLAVCSVFHGLLPDSSSRGITLAGLPYKIVLDTRTSRAFILGGRTMATIAGEAIVGSDLTVLDTATGRILRTTQLGTNPTDLLVDTQTDRLFITDIVDDTVSVFDARSGTLIHTVAVGAMQSHDLQRIADDPRRQLIYVSAVPPRVLNARTGAAITSMAGSGESVVVDDRTGHVFLANFDNGTVSTYAARGGRLVRTVTVGPRPLHLLTIPGFDRVFVKGSHGISILDANTGRVLHTIPIGAARFAQLVGDPATGRVLVTDPDSSSVSTLDARTGAIIHTVKMASAPFQAVVDARTGHAFVLSQGSVRMLDARRGTVSRTIAVRENPAGAAIDETRGRLFVMSSGPTDSRGMPTGVGSVSVVDTGSGALLCTRTVGRNPLQAVVDQRTGYLFVVNEGGALAPADTWGWVPDWLRVWVPPLAHQPAAGGSVTMIDVAHSCD